MVGVFEGVRTMLLRKSGSTINLERRPELHQSVQAVAVEGYPTNLPNPLPAHAYATKIFSIF